MNGVLMKDHSLLSYCFSRFLCFSTYFPETAEAFDVCSLFYRNTSQDATKKNLTRTFPTIRERLKLKLLEILCFNY